MKKQKCVITTIANPCAGPGISNPCCDALERRDGCSNLNAVYDLGQPKVTKLEAIGKLDSEGNLHVLLKSNNCGGYEIVDACDPLYENYHYDSEGLINGDFFDTCG